MDNDAQRELLFAITQHRVVLYTWSSSIYVPGVLSEALDKSSKQQQVLAVSELAEKSARHVCSTMSETIGHRIGYSVPFDNYVSELTEIKYVSPQMMIWEALVDPTLSAYRVIVVEHCEQRLAWMDTAVALLKKILRARKDLTLVLGMSNESLPIFKEYFGTAAGIVDFEPKELAEAEYKQEPSSDYIASLVATIAEIKRRENRGSVLAIVSSAKEVESVRDRLAKLGVRDYVISVVWDDLEERADYVVDSGFVRREWLLRGAIEYKTSPISKAELQQRRRRAYSKFFCIYTVEAAHELDENPPAQIQAYDVSDITLRLMALGVTNLVDFDYITAPSAAQLAFALNTLKMLGAVDDKANVTTQGRMMASLPVSSQLATAIAHSATLGCFDEMLKVAACSVVGGLEHFLRTPKEHEKRQLAIETQDQFRVREGDHLTMLNIFSLASSAQYISGRALERAANVHRQLKTLALRYAKVSVTPPDDRESVSQRVLECLARGFGYQLAKRMNLEHDYILVGANAGQQVRLHSSSVLYTVDMLHGNLSPWVIYENLLEINGNFYIKNVSVIDRPMLPPIYSVKSS